MLAAQVSDKIRRIGHICFFFSFLLLRLIIFSPQTNVTFVTIPDTELALISHSATAGLLDAMRNYPSGILMLWEHLLAVSRNKGV